MGSDQQEGGTEHTLWERVSVAQEIALHAGHTYGSRDPRWMHAWEDLRTCLADFVQASIAAGTAPGDCYRLIERRKAERR